MGHAHARSAARRDDNEREMVEAWRRLGCLWFAMPPGVGFDGILLSASRGVMIVEVKRVQPGRKKWTITEIEQNVRAQVEQLGIAYYIVSTLDEALALVGAE